MDFSWSGLNAHRADMIIVKDRRVALSRDGCSHLLVLAHQLWVRFFCWIQSVRFRSGDGWLKLKSVSL